MSNKLPCNCFKCKIPLDIQCKANEYGDKICKQINGIIDDDGIEIIFTDNIPSEIGQYLFLSDKYQQISVVDIEPDDLSKQTKNSNHLGGGKWCKVKKLIW